MPESEPLAESSGVRAHRESFDDDDVASSPRVAPPVREGLPPGFRMRADAHYVDQLDTRMSSIPVRLIDTQSIDAAQQNGDLVTPAFVESVRRFGVLQPLLVSARGSRYRVIAGRRRLAAATAAGLREVPCLVQHVDGEQADQMALASNLPAARPRPAAPSLNGAASPAAAAAAELAQSLAALTACADLITSGSTLGQSAAADLVRAETGRAADLLRALRILRDEIPVARARTGAAAVLDQVSRSAEARRGAAGRVRVERPRDLPPLVADPRLLAETLVSLAAVAAALAEAAFSPAGGRDVDDRLSLVIAASAPDATQLAFTVTQGSVELPGAWLARPFDIPWPVRDGGAFLVMLQAARRVAQAHGGDAQVEAADGGTVFTLAIPTAPQA